MPSFVTCLHCRDILPSADAYRRGTRTFCDDECADLHNEQRAAKQRARHKILRKVQAPVVLSVTPALPGVQSPWDLPLSARVDYVKRVAEQRERNRGRGE